MGKAAREQGRERRRHEVEERRTEFIVEAGDLEGVEYAVDEASAMPLGRMMMAETPLARLHAIPKVREWIDGMQAAAVAELRAVNVPWAVIGRALGVTGQAAAKRYGQA